MILECPQCHARFLVADSMIPPQGRIVRCGACSNQWHVDSPNPEPAAPEILPEPPAEIAPMPAGSNVPALKKRTISKRPFMMAFPVLALLWLVLAMITYFPVWMDVPLLERMYKPFGITKTDRLVFTDVHMEREQDGTKTRFIITGSIVNHDAVTRHVPTVRVMLKDKNGKKIWSRDYDVNVALEGGAVYPFRIANVETSFAANVKTIVLDLGHGLQLMVR